MKTFPTPAKTTSSAFSPDSKRMFAFCAGQGVLILDAQDGRALKQSKQREGVVLADSRYTVGLTQRLRSVSQRFKSRLGKCEESHRLDSMGSKGFDFGLV